MQNDMPPAPYALPSQRASAQYAFTFVVDAAPARVFELVTPEGERQWAPDWNPHYLTASRLEERTVFETGGKHDPRIWIIDLLDIGHGHIRYVSVKPGREAATIEVTAQGENGKTLVHVAYNVVSLNEQSDAEVRDSIPDATALAEHWRHAFESALRSGHR